MPMYKVVNGVRTQLTEAEEAELDADREAGDLDMTPIRALRDGRLRGTDWTQLTDAPLGAPTAEEWATYRQALRDLPATYSRVSELVWPNDPPTQAAIDAAAE